MMAAYAAVALGKWKDVGRVMRLRQEKDTKTTGFEAGNHCMDLPYGEGVT